jgi:hypothetical protein
LKVSFCDIAVAAADADGVPPMALEAIGNGSVRGPTRRACLGDEYVPAAQSGEAVEPAHATPEHDPGVGRPKRATAMRSPRPRDMGSNILVPPAARVIGEIGAFSRRLCFRRYATDATSSQHLGRYRAGTD